MSRRRWHPSKAENAQTKETPGEASVAGSEGQSWSDSQVGTAESRTLASKKIEASPSFTVHGSLGISPHVPSPFAPVRHVAVKHPGTGRHCPGMAGLHGAP